MSAVSQASLKHHVISAAAFLRYRKTLPRTEDVRLIVEVADSTLGSDRDVKIPLYGRHGIPESWLVDLQTARLHVFTRPSIKGYLESRSLADPGILKLPAMPACEVDLGGLFEA
ncbi:MAG: Uma2 family endonuclease [Thiotrichales bacterium]